MSARRSELTRQAATLFAREGLPRHVDRRHRRGARASRRARSTRTSPRRRTCSGRRCGRERPPSMPRSTGSPTTRRQSRRSARRCAATSASSRSSSTSPPCSSRSGATSKAPGARSSSPSGDATRSGSASCCARGVTSATSAPISTSGARHCSSSRRRTGRTPGSSRAATPTSSPTASWRCSSTGCAATPLLVACVRATLIVNPFATRVNEARVRALEEPPGRGRDAAHRAGGHAIELAREAQGEAVFAYGGDGLVNEVLNGLPPGKPLGIVAGGHTNVLARALGVAERPGAGRAGAADLTRARQRPPLLVLRRHRRRLGDRARAGDPEARRRRQTTRRPRLRAGRDSPSVPPVRAPVRGRGPRPRGDDLRLERRGLHLCRAARLPLLARGALRARARLRRAGAAARAASALAATSAAGRPAEASRATGRAARRTTSTGSTSAVTSHCRCRPTARTSATSTEAVFEAERDAVAVLVA